MLTGYITFIFYVIFFAYVILAFSKFFTWLFTKSMVYVSIINKEKNKYDK